MAFQSFPVTASGQVIATPKPGVIQGAKLVAAAAAATATIHDGTNAAGPVLFKLSAPVNGADDLVVPVLYNAGVYVELTGAGAQLNVFA